VNLPGELILIAPLLVVELLVGMVIGLTASVIVQGLAMAGEVLSLQMGLSLGRAVAPMSDLVVPGIGQIKSFLALMIYVSIGGHLLLLQGLAESLRVLPPGLKIEVESGVQLGSHLMGTVYTSAIRAAAPAMVALLLTDLAVAITSRAVPQLHAIMVLFPITIGVGLIVIGASLPMVASTVAGWMSELPDKVTYAIQGFRTSAWGS
jgi:flagellar biosynthetic protein FliR